ncbi:hypothetical protein K9N68_22930 [Kovacikia minuta CCNUW1]|uniref:hypothetical protein n=1 Tax=Kovacikia minuta TaxID=2931930 RepID=UPI001CCD1FC3|nr:hypothetical protein [Kovacikia minuta]UBF24525.1 hypothetical protein K9N68_22930 [Kovacikia minuta CCNUW1]
MQKTDTTSSPAPDMVKRNWEFTEVWIDPMLSPPYVLVLLGDRTGNCQIFDPAEGYKAVFSSSIYEEAQLWLLEDEYEPIEGRLTVSGLS